MDRWTGTIKLAACDGYAYRERTDLFFVCEMTWYAQFSLAPAPEAGGNQHCCTESCATRAGEVLSRSDTKVWSQLSFTSAVSRAVKILKKKEENIFSCSTFFFTLPRYQGHTNFIESCKNLRVAWICHLGWDFCPKTSHEGLFTIRNLLAWTLSCEI